MADLFHQLITRHVDAHGKRVPRGTPGAKIVREKSKKWYTRMKVAGKWKPVPLSTNKTAASIMAGKLLDKQEMGRAGVTNRYEAHSNTPLAQHLKDWQASLEAKNCTPKHVQMKISRVQSIIDHCQFVFLRCLSASEVESCLAEFRKKPRFSAQTSNHYLRAIKGFTHWLTRNKRIPDDPLSHLQLGNVALDRRHDRREISGPELAYLFQSTRQGPERCKLSGPDREMAYCVACYTGLRASEIASLHAKSFRLESETATVAVEAAYSKHRRKDVVPLHPDLVERLSSWLADKPSTGKLWPGKWALHNHAGKMLQRDLKAARAEWLAEAESDEDRQAREKTDFLAYRDSKGLYADFHALRHTMVSRLVRAGVAPKIAQTLARHSSIQLTMDKYAHIELSEAVDGMSQMESIPQARQDFGYLKVTYEAGSDRELSRTNESDACLTVEAETMQNVREISQEPLTTKGKALSFHLHAPVAQLDRASVYGTEVVKPQPYSSKATYANQPSLVVHRVTYEDELQPVIDAWPSLPRHLQQAILAIVEAAKTASPLRAAS